MPPQAYVDGWLDGWADYLCQRYSVLARGEQTHPYCREWARGYNEGWLARQRKGRPLSWST